ncbi:MAG: hypothetical protein WBE81_31305, partial [Pseudolabrys sp.]
QCVYANKLRCGEGPPPGQRSQTAPVPGIDVTLLQHHSVNRNQSRASRALVLRQNADVDIPLPMTREKMIAA